MDRGDLVGAGDAARRGDWPAPHGLVRARLLDRLLEPARLTLIIAPAGCGKTTLLAQHAGAASGPTAWLRADRMDTHDDRFVARLGRALRRAGVLDQVPDAAGIDELLTGSAESAGGPVRVVIDDAHLLLNSPAERCIEEILLRDPSASIVLASRRLPSVNLGRAEIAPITVITADDLRFRSWEVERLFRDVYDEPLPPDDIAALTRRVDGWAACLQLFHLSTRARSLGERRKAVRALAGGSRFARTYLARTVLDELPRHLATFLTRTCVFELLTAARCDALLGTGDAQRMLEELERREALTTSDDGGETFRYHEVLRRHLEGALRAALGAAETAEWYCRTAALLEDRGAPGEAVRAYLRAGRWDRAATLLRADGARVIQGDHGTAWHDLLPPQLVDEDPWLSMVLARQLTLEGRLDPAVERYRHAESIFPDLLDRHRAAQARRLVELWTAGRPQPQPHLHWLDRLRAAVRRTPGQAFAAGAVHSSGDRFGAAAASVLAGDVAAAQARLAPLLDDVELDGWLPIAAQLLRAVTDLASARADECGGDRLAAESERIGATWLSRQAQILTALRAGDDEAIQRVTAQCEAAGDAWGGLLGQAAGALHRLFAGEPAITAFHAVAKRCRVADAGTLEAWALGFAARAAVAEGHPDAAAMTRAAESFARACGVWGVQALSTPASAQAGRATRHAGPTAVTVAERPAMTLRCFGGFSLEVADRSLDWRPVRPRAAATLRLLAISMPQPVHREALLGLWPELPPDRGLHSLQVAVSSLRGVLTPDEPRGASRVVRRQGDAYRLVLPEGSTADVITFAEGLRDADRARHTHRVELERTALSAALTLYVGDLLPEDGPAEWVIAVRERFRTQAARAAERLAVLGLECGDLRSAIDAARRSLAIDRYVDASWRILITAYTRAGEDAAAARARREYADVLDALGVPRRPAPPPALPVPGTPTADRQAADRRR